MQPVEHRLEGLLQRLGLEGVVEQMGDDLGIGVGRKDVALRLQFGLEHGVVFDDAVVDQADLAGRMRVGVGHIGRAVGGPAGVADADDALDRLGHDGGFEVADLAGGAAAVGAGSALHGDAGRVIAAVFETAQGFQQARGHGFAADDSDDAAHVVLSSI